MSLTSSLVRNRQRNRCALEMLEPRALLHGTGFEAGINFQKGTPAAPAGYFLDAGQVFGDRGNGLAYGWDADNTAAARDRNNSLSPDQRYDTLTHMQLYGTRTWEIAVPNGSYTVHVVGGDPSAADSTLGIAVEGTLAVSGKTTSTQRWREGTVTVQVNDGRLTVSNAPGAVNNKIDFIDIHADDGTGVPTVSVAVGDGSAGESGPNAGTFIVSRQGDTAQPLTVNYAVSGNATAEADYVALSGSVVIPAGATSAVVTVTPIDDNASEGSEGVALTLLESADYDLTGSGTSASILIADNDGGGTGFSAKVNFQPAGSLVPTGYVADTGSVFGDRGSGLAYGWNVNNASYARDRNSGLSADQRYDTINQMQRTGGGTVWEIAVLSGAYTVHVVAGDAGAYDSTYAINIEGALAVSGKPTSSVRWFEGTRTVQVSDGRLTVTNAAGSSNNKIAFIDISSDGGQVLPQVSIAATDGAATETPGNGGRFTVTRTGPVDQPLVVNLSVGGSATNGADYTALGSTVTIPAGAASAVVTVTPIDDSAAEGTETVVVRVAASGNYTVAPPSSAIVSILDNDATGTTLTWREVAPAPVGRSEAFGAVVGGKLYVFGGYVDSTFKPTRRADVYDPATNSWRQLADLPSWAYPLGGASHVGTAVVGQSIYFAGGYPASNSSQTFSTKAVLKYDTTTNTYTPLPSLPEARGGAALVALGRVLHFFGGSDSARADAGTHWQLDLDNLTAGWVTKASLPVATNHVAGVALDGKVYAIGGQQNQDAAAIQRAEVQVYDPATDRWTARAPLPSARSHITSATLVRDGKILVLGGLGPGNTVLNKVSSYDPTTNTWTNLTNLPSGRLSGISDVLPDGRILFSTGGGGGYRTTTWIGEWL